MIIKGNDFKMEQAKASPFFDLYLSTIINKDKDNEREEMKLDGYSKTFYSCVMTIISARLEKIDKECSASEFIQLFIDELDHFSENLNVIYLTSEDTENTKETKEVKE